MLKALELVGFKSFADKTRFEFPPGITVVVGPNGSGKSNVVDAIKWVLGEQSVKSLRGKEMADVIFNGSGSRKPVNSAEITITLDNAGHQLGIDTPEVHLTRRVYRSGEGEYLINRQPCRLRDIRDMLAGTGLGAEAYSVIEQGKVDGLLQSSPKDRRLIFEEAAGISRFKAKKLEALRRLERVEQNLLRLHDIVEEVESRLKNVRAQAAKARRYKEHADRLQQLRTQVGLFDWRSLTERLDALEADVRAITEERDTLNATVETMETRLLETDAKTAEINEVIQASEAQVASNRERIAAAESTIEHQRGRSRDLDEEIARFRRQVMATSVRAGDLQQQLTATVESVDAAEAEHQQVARRLGETERRLTEVLERLDRTRAEEQQRRQGLLEQMRTASVLGNEISALESRRTGAESARDRLQQRLAELDREVERFDQQWQQLQTELDALAKHAQDGQARLAEAQERLQQDHRRQEAVAGELAQLLQREISLTERITVVEELENRQEGLSSGVKEALALARQGEGPLRYISGLVADVFQVNVESASLLEAVLGPIAQHVVAPWDPELIDALERGEHRFSGRVGFVWIDEPVGTQRSLASLDGLEGVIGRGDRFIETEPRFRGLAERLLGNAWIVQDLGRALDLAAGQGTGCGFVTLAGEYLAADGTLVVGPRQAAEGLISRRSQLRAWKAQLAELHARIARLDAHIQQLQEKVECQARTVEQAQRDQADAAARLAEHRLRMAGARQQQITLAQQHEQCGDECRQAVDTLQQAAEAETAARSRRAEVDQSIREVEAGLAQVAAGAARCEEEQRELARRSTELRVELAKSEERLGSLQARLHQVKESRHERQRASDEARQQLAEAIERSRQAQFAILRAESDIAQLYIRKESLVVESAQLIRQRFDLQQERTSLTGEAQKLRSRVKRIEERLHAKELQANEVRMERQTLVQRLREDYGIELAALENEPSAEEQQERTAAQQEIEELRRRINNLGNVNLEALEELDQLESRHELLNSQYKDLVDAKGALEKIIERINTDSRRLFIETLQTVKGHFQNLFRDLFGGGRADIVFEEGVDVLESGIEIVARPPGKEPRSISLLSGGEKTLTCVALLLAIFRSRPSPFCVLDEVDAALDEANIDRFTKVLGDFLAWTQFIIVTHSKKTMTCASTIYGVTMQDSGVSKQVSVRFEDVSEDGRILQDHINARGDDDPQSEAA